jgi:hypothetical protein
MLQGALLTKQSWVDVGPISRGELVEVCFDSDKFEKLGRTRQCKYDDLYDKTKPATKPLQSARASGSNVDS